MLIILLFFLILILFAVVVPLAVGIGLLKSKYKKAGKIILGTYGLMAASFLFFALHDRRSAPARIMRFCLGAGLARQEIEDVAAKLRPSPSLSKMQNWAIETMQRFQAGQCRTNGPSPYWSIGTVQLAHSELADFITIPWEISAPPEISIRLSTSGAPECVLIEWYEKGVAFGNKTYHLPPLHDADDHIEIIPGVYAYYTYK